MHCSLRHLLTKLSKFKQPLIMGSNVETARTDYPSVSSRFHEISALANELFIDTPSLGKVTETKRAVNGRLFTVLYHECGTNRLQHFLLSSR